MERNSTQPGYAFEPDELVFLRAVDTLVPAQIIGRTEHDHVRVRVTGGRRTLRRGQIVTARPGQLIPRRAVRTHRGQRRVLRFGPPSLARLPHIPSERLRVPVD